MEDKISNNISGKRVSEEVQTEEAAPSGAPIYIRVTKVLPTEVAVVWQAPACLQTNGEITKYEFEAKLLERRDYQIDGTIKQAVRGTRTKITGLAPYTKYSVRIRAFTRKDPGPWSEPVQFQTAAAPDVRQTSKTMFNLQTSRTVKFPHEIDQFFRSEHHRWFEF